MRARLLSLSIAGLVASGLAMTPASAETTAARLTTTETAPWPREQAAMAEQAVEALEKLLVAKAQTERGTSVETLMTMAGALAGYSAQHAIREGVLKQKHTGAAKGSQGLVIATTADGQTYYFGDLLNSFLVPQQHPLGPGNSTLYSFLSAAAAEIGQPPLGRKDVEDIFRHTAQTIGSPDFGNPRSAEARRSNLTPRQALDALWPEVAQLLSRTDWPGGGGTTLSVLQWPAVTATTARRLVRMAAKPLDPTVAMRIVMEAAIPMSKVDLKAPARGPDMATQTPTPAAAGALPALLSIGGSAVTKVEQGRKPDGQAFVEYRDTAPKNGEMRTLAFSHYPGSGGEVSSGVKLLVDVVRKNIDPPKINVLENPQSKEVIVDWLTRPDANGEVSLALVRYSRSEAGDELISAYCERRWKSGTREPADIAAERARLLDDLAKLDLAPARRHFAEFGKAPPL